MERNLTTNRIVRPPTAALITKKTASAMGLLSKEKRQERTARMIRSQIRSVTAEKFGVRMNTSSEAVAVTAGTLWQDVVLNPEAYARDRILAFNKIGQIADEIPNVLQRTDAEKTPAGAAASAIGTELARQFMDIVRDVLTAQTRQAAQDPNVIDTRPAEAAESGD
jgi:hypothetical protein